MTQVLDLSHEMAMSILSDKLKENGATFNDILAISTLAPSLVALVKSLIPEYDIRMRNGSTIKPVDYGDDDKFLGVPDG